MVDVSARRPPEPGGVAGRGRSPGDRHREVVTAARRQLASRPGGELSLRALARDVGTSPAELLGEVGSRERLLGAVVSTVVDEAAAALDQGLRRADPRAPHLRQAEAMAAAYRAWGRRHRADVALLLGPDRLVPDEPRHRDQVVALLDAPLRHYADGLRRGAVRRPPRATAYAATRPVDVAGLRPHELGTCLHGWLAISGHLWMEVADPLGRWHDDPAAAWRAQVRETLRAIGYADVSAGDPPAPPRPPRW